MRLLRSLVNAGRCYRHFSVTRNSKNNALEHFIKEKIRVSGPITVAEYMQMCTGLYYSNVDLTRKQEAQTSAGDIKMRPGELFGPAGDFITAPGLSQLFGEMIGVWCYNELASTGHTRQWQLIELGPGTGQLMHDLLTAIHKFDETKVTVCLVETSDHLIRAQEQLLCSKASSPVEGQPHIRYNTSRQGVPIYWYRTVDELPQKQMNFLMHSQCTNFNEILTGNGMRGLLSETIRNDPSWSTWEISPSAGTIVNQIAERITVDGGFALLIDYGHDGTRRDLSLRAYKQHEQVHPLSSPGQVDITADVNFAYLRSLVKDRCLIYGPIDQREFLAQLGIELRLRRLVNRLATREEKENLIRGYNMLLSDEGLGTKFKAFSIYPKTLAGIHEKRGGAPAGFAMGNPNEETTNEKGDAK